MVPGVYRGEEDKDEEAVDVDEMRRGYSGVGGCGSQATGGGGHRARSRACSRQGSGGRVGERAGAGDSRTTRIGELAQDVVGGPGCVGGFRRRKDVEPSSGGVLSGGVILTMSATVSAYGTGSQRQRCC